MRPQLLLCGVFVALLGGLLWVVPLPIFYAWSLPLVVGGGLMCIVSFFMEESLGRLVPPEGFKFCVFCTTLMSKDVTICPQCSGHQPAEVS